MLLIGAIAMLPASATAQEAAHTRSSAAVITSPGRLDVSGSGQLHEEATIAASPGLFQVGGQAQQLEPSIRSGFGLARGRAGAIADRRPSFRAAVGAPALAESRSHPILRTLAALAGSAGAFAYAEERADEEPDDIQVPMAAAVAGGALGALLFTNAGPIRVVLGSALAALPAAAIATYLAGSTEDEDQHRYLPLIAFSLPHGLLTSALAQHRE